MTMIGIVQIHWKDTKVQFGLLILIKLAIIWVCNLFLQKCKSIYFNLLQTAIIVSASDDKSLKFWKSFPNNNQEGLDTYRVHPKWKSVYTLSGHHSRCIYSVSWSKIHGRIASGSGDNVIRVFEQDNSQDETNSPNFSLVAS